MRFSKLILFLVLWIACIYGASAQEVPYLRADQAPVEYEIGGVEVVGAGTRDLNAIKSIAKLREGKKIMIPSDQIASGVKGLYRLGIFENVEIYQDSVVEDVVFLRINLIERPTLFRYTFTGIKKTQQEDLSEILDDIIKKGEIVNFNKKSLAIDKIKEYYIDKGHLDVAVDIEETEDKNKDNAVRLIFNVDKKERVKVNAITFAGNESVKERKLRKLMKETKRKGTFLRKSKYIKENYEEDKQKIIAHYNKNGMRDAVIVNDSIWRDEEGMVNIHLDINEGNRYYFRNIDWKGNSIYTDEQLSAILGILPGDIFNMELLQNRMSFSQDGRDISSLYLDQGYLFFNVEPTEIAVVNDSIDVEMRITEGAQATIDNVVITGNDRTHEHVIRRELRTRPGEKFSRSEIIRSQRQIMNLGYFNPETLDIQTPPNPARGTVDIVYKVEERPSDQLELSAGYGGVSGLIGTLGVTFNNFSAKNIRDRSTWNPLPQGDGQKLSLRVQSNSRFFRSYNASFTEPWLGGNKPTSFTIGTAISAFDNTNFGGGALNITRLFTGLGTQLKFPDDFFVSNTVMNIEWLRLSNYQRAFLVEDGTYRNFNINQTFTRSSVNEPIYPRSGSRVSLSIQFTPPYSLFRDNDYWLMTDQEKSDAIRDINRTRGIRDKLTETQELDEIRKIEEARKFTLLEYHKWKFNAEWYFNFTDKLVMMTSAKMGFLGSYNDNIGIVPFERFEYGGDGLSNQNSGITGTDILSARGYDTTDFPDNNQGGGVIFNKFTVEMRYPLSLNPASTIYLHTFIQGGNVWGDFRDYNPFGLQRSAGGGLRVFLPMFGLLGFDYGWGFDKDDTGANFGGYGKFNIVLGFEPE